MITNPYTISSMLTHYLHPSQCVVPLAATQVTTVLGSCVSVCLYDRVEEKGGINHYMLPKWNGVREVTHMYGNLSINALINRMLATGSLKENLIAKVFGGSDRVDSFNNIGQQNIEQARHVLSKHDIRIVAKNIGGERARKIIFDTQSGVVRMKYINYDNTIN